VSIKTCLETEKSILVSALQKTIHTSFSYMVEEHETESAYILGTSVVLDTESTGTPNTEAVSCEREDGLPLVQAI